MKIFTTKQIYEADQATLIAQGIRSDELMERAGVEVFNWLHLRLNGIQKRIQIFCGVGNNGGDGLVVARHLHEHGYTVLAYIVQYSTVYSDDFLINLERLKKLEIDIVFLDTTTGFPEINNEDIIIDAIFGIGLNREPAGWLINLITHLNNSKAFILSVDVPSGLYMDKVPEDEKAVVNASHVLTFQTAKLNFFLPQTGIYIDHWEVLQIGLDMEYINNVVADYELIGKNEVLKLYRPREKFSHKGTYGHALIIGGHRGKIGAVILAAEACLTSGSGMVTAFLPGCGLLPIQTAVPEVMAITDADTDKITHINFGIVPTVIGIGVGLGKEEPTKVAFSEFLQQNKLPLVLDADALNILSEQPSLLQFLPPQSILTPHPKELERLIGKWKDDFDKLEKTKAFSIEYNCIVIIKGAHSIIVYEKRGYINTTGNPGMATAGSGDVLTGMITGLIAQGYTPLKASILGVYLHGRAGDIAIEEYGYQALTAGMLINFIGKAYLDLFKRMEDSSNGN